VHHSNTATVMLYQTIYVFMRDRRTSLSHILCIPLVTVVAVRCLMHGFSCCSFPRRYCDSDVYNVDRRLLLRTQYIVGGTADSPQLRIQMTD